MENGWQMKWSPTLPSSTPAVTSSSVQIQSLESRNQLIINLDMGHSIIPNDARGTKLMYPGMNQAPTFSSLLSFGPCKSVDPDIGNSFLSPLSTPPSFLQSDFHHQLNFKTSSGNYYLANSSLNNACTMPNWPLQHNSINLNPRPMVDVRPVFPSRTTVSANNCSSRVLCDDRGALRALSSLSSGGGELCRVSNSNAMLEACLETPSSKRTSVVGGCPRVFCMGACGDLLLSSTGLLGIVCSCHGLHMSVSNFCEHSGFSNVNPGYAVRMESGESIAQWRKQYLQKFGIRAPENHRGWDWPEGMLSSPGLAKSSTAVTNKSKVFDLSCLFTSSAESVISRQPGNNVFTRKPQSSQEYANKLSQNEHKESGCGQQNSFLPGFPGTSRRNSNTLTENPIIACPTSSSLTMSRAIGKGQSGDNCQLRSLSSLGSAFQNFQTSDSKTYNNLKDDIVLQRAPVSSSIELTLGQPSQQQWGRRSAALSSSRPQINDLRAITFQAQPSHKSGNSKVVEHNRKPPGCRPASDLSKAEEQFQLDLLNNARSMVNNASSLEHLKDGLSNNSAISMLVPPYNSSAGGNVQHNESNKRINDSHPSIPWTLHSRSHVDRSRLIDFSSNEVNDAMRPLDFNKIALRKNENRTMDARCGHSNVGCESSFRLYTKQKEMSDFLIRNGKICHPNSCAPPGEKFNSLQMASTLPDNSGASNYVGNVCSLGSNPVLDRFSERLGNSSLNFEKTPILQATSASSAHWTVFRAPAHDSSSPNNNVVALDTHMSDESLRVLDFRNVEKPFEEKLADGSLGLNRQLSDQRKQSTNLGIADSRVHDSFLHPGPSKGQTNACHIGHNASPTFLPDVGGKKDGDIREGTTVEGTNIWQDTGYFTGEVALHLGVTDKYNQGLSGPQSKDQPSLRGENPVQTKCSNRERDSKGTSSINGKKQVNVTVVESSELNGSRFAKDSAPIGKAILVECSQKFKELRPRKLDCLDYQWRDVPSKVNTVSKIRCLDASIDIRSRDQVAEFPKGKELSNISSGSSAAAVTKTSMEVNKIASSTGDACDIGNDNDQIVDQGSAVDRSWSSADGIDSVRSCEHVCCGKARYTETCHGLGDEFKRKCSKSKELQNLGGFGSSFGEVSSDKQNYEGQFKPRKRKHSTTWRMLGTPLNFSDVSSLDNRTSEDFQAFPHSQDSYNMLHANPNYRSFKRRRSGWSSVKILSRKRDLNGIHDIVEGGSDDDSVDIPKNAAVKRLKRVKPAEPVKKQVKSTEAAKQFRLYNSNSDNNVKASFKGSQMDVLVSDETIGNHKAKPLACGKYGIICNQELDIDQLKPPKIVPLSQVLKASRRFSKLEKQPLLPSLKKLYKVNFNGGSTCFDGSLSSSTGKGSRCNKILSCKSGDHDPSIHENVPTSHKEDETYDPSMLEKFGASRSKRNLSVSSCFPTSQSKPKEIRMRSLYELSMRGKKIISADFSLSQNVMCAPSAESELERNASEDTGKSEGGKCRADSGRSLKKSSCSSLVSELDALCCVCGMPNKDNTNCLLECGHCLIRIHQACYGISRLPKGDWYCRPCRTSSEDVACVLCGYGGGAMTRAFGSRNAVKSLLKAWNIRTESLTMGIGSAEALYVPAKMESESKLESAKIQPSPSIKLVVHNSIIAGLFDPTVKQWIHMVCGLWTSGTRCPNVDTMSAFDVSGVSYPKSHLTCYLCNRPGGSCIRCRVEACSTRFHPWCGHRQGLLQSEVEGVDCDKVGFYGRCLLHANHQPCPVGSDNDTNKVDSETERDKESTCARTEGYKGKKQDKGRHSLSYQRNGEGGCLVTQVQLDAWVYINRQKLSMKRQPRPQVSDVDHDYKKEYARYKQAKGWKRLVVYKSGIHALGLYTSQFFPRGAMVVEYVGEIVGQRVADKREMEYLSGRKLQYKSACYFFRIDKEQIIDATCKGGIARFVNHSCQPNCVAKVIAVRSGKKVVFLAQRDIYPGEEITYDYHFNHEDEGKKIPCLCNSSNCRRYLN